MIEVQTKLDEFFNVGAHYGFSKTRRHPSAEKFIFGSKNRVDLFDLEKTQEALEKALDFASSIIKNNGTILFVGGKSEAKQIVEKYAKKVGAPYVAGRWIGGTLTNWDQIRKRVDTMLDLLMQKEKGELAKYTKKERLLIDRDIEKLQKMFGGITTMTVVPKALFIVDPRYEDTALREAKRLNIPIVALCGSDNNMNLVDYPIPGNDSNRASIEFFVNKLAESYNK
ncbi:MAG: 30S ribosomal protein S2 [Patescibacteria group bacterium]